MNPRIPCQNTRGLFPDTPRTSLNTPGHLPNTGRPSRLTRRPFPDPRRPSLNTQRYFPNTGRPSRFTRRRSLNTQRPLPDTQRPSQNTGRPSVNPRGLSTIPLKTAFPPASPSAPTRAVHGLRIAASTRSRIRLAALEFGCSGPSTFVYPVSARCMKASASASFCWASRQRATL